MPPRDPNNPEHRAELRELYRIAVEQYRFEVSLNWDRTKFYLTLNSALIGAGIGMQRFGLSALTWLVFAMGFFVSILGVLAILRERGYYLVTVYKKTLIEKQLGYLNQIEGYSHELATLGIASTVDQRKSVEILTKTDGWIRRSRLPVGTTMFYVTCVLGFYAVLNLCAILYFLDVFNLLLSLILGLMMRFLLGWEG